jgi:hypothetical protein
MKIEIDADARYVEIRMGFSTYLFDRDNYDALFHAMLHTPASDVAWVSCVTNDMIDASCRAEVIDELNDYVANTIVHYYLGND